MIPVKMVFDFGGGKEQMGALPPGPMDTCLILSHQ